MPFRARRLAVAGLSWRVALLPAAAFAVHQLRYELAFGAGAGAELSRTGHSYLHSLVPWLVAALALAGGCCLKGLGDALAGHRSRGRFTASFTGLWLGCTIVLVAVFVCQEQLEGVFAAGHPGGLGAAFGEGGWWAVPVAVCVALVLAAVLHGARWAVDAIARRRAPRRSSQPAALPLLRSYDALLPALAPLPAGRPTRGPPIAA